MKRLWKDPFMVYFKVPPVVLSEGHDTKKTKAGQPHSTLNFCNLVFWIWSRVLTIQPACSFKTNEMGIMAVCELVTCEHMEVQYHIHKSLPLVPILSQINLVYASLSHFLKICFNIILLSIPKSSKWFCPSCFPTKTLYAPLLQATCPAHLILLDLVAKIIFVEGDIWQSSSLCNLLHFPVNSSLLGPNVPQHPILKHTQPMFLPQCDTPSFTPMQNNRQNCSSVYFNFYIFGW